MFRLFSQMKMQKEFHVLFVLLFFSLVTVVVRGLCFEPGVCLCDAHRSKEIAGSFFTSFFSFFFFGLFNGEVNGCVSGFYLSVNVDRCRMHFVFIFTFLKCNDLSLANALIHQTTETTNLHLSRSTPTRRQKNEGTKQNQK